MRSLLKRWWFWLGAVGLAGLFFDSPRSAAYKKGLRTRDTLDDEAFYNQFYASTNTPKDIPIRLRKILAKRIDHLLWKVHPGDNFGLINDDLDMIWMFNWVAKEFGIAFDSSDWEGRDSFTFDWFVQCIEKKSAPSIRRFG